jgi:hypothetical protein
MRTNSMIIATTMDYIKQYFTLVKNKMVQTSYKL